MKYYEENSAAMSEDDDNVDIESDVSVYEAEIDFRGFTRDLYSEFLFRFFLLKTRMMVTI